jgi:O-antigen/teichoic acid export membrane protein
VWGATLLSALARQWGALCTFLTLAVLARTLVPADFGRFTFWLAVLSFLDVFVDCGTSSVAVQRGADDPAVFAAALAAGRRVRAVAALLGAVVVAGLATWTGEEDLPWVCLAALGPLARVPEMSAVVFQRDIEWGRPLALRAVGSTLRLLVILALATRPGLGFGPYLAAHAASLALGNVAIHFVAAPRLPPAAPPLRGLLASALPLALTGLVQQAYFYADNGFVRAFAGAEELGYYNAAVRLFLWLSFFAAFATTSALPWFARRHAAGELGRAAGEVALPLVLVAALAAGALLPWRAELLRLAFRPGFERASTSLAWLLGALVAVGFGAAFLTAVIAAGRTHAAFGVALVALAVNLAGNALLVPHLGAEGAALMTLVTEASVALGALVVLRSIGAWPFETWARFLAAPPLFAAAWLASRALFAVVPR